MSRIDCILFLGLTVTFVGAEGSALGEVREGGWPKCMSGLQYPQALDNAMKKCSGKSWVQIKPRLASHLNDTPTFSLIKELKMELNPIYGGCIVDEMGYALVNGSLDKRNVIGDYDNVKTSSVVKLFRLRAMVMSCFSESTSKEANKEMAFLLECVRTKATEYCDGQKVILETYLNSDVQPSPCAAVQAPPQLDEYIEKCNAEDEKKEERERGPRRRRSSSQEKSALPIQARMSLCTGARLGFYSARTGFSFAGLTETITNLEGFNTLPEDLQGKIHGVLSTCQDSVGNSTKSFTVWFRWEMCARQETVRLCGFGNNVTKTLFPTLEGEVKQVAWKYVFGSLGVTGGKEEENSNRGQKRNK